MLQKKEDEKNLACITIINKCVPEQKRSMTITTTTSKSFCHFIGE
jgi:hypothetical protein